MAETLTNYESMVKIRRTNTMERELPPKLPEENEISKQTEQSPELEGAAQEKPESKANVESGVTPVKRPEKGIDLFFWNIAERIVISESTRVEQLRHLSEKVKSKDQLRLVLLLIENKIHQIMRSIYIPLFQMILRKYRDSFDTLVHRAYLPKDIYPVQREPKE